jgi:hypothetical protein
MGFSFDDVENLTTRNYFGLCGYLGYSLLGNVVMRQSSSVKPTAFDSQHCRHLVQTLY